MHGAIPPARTLMRERRYAEAVALLEGAISDAPDDPDLRCERLIARFHLGDEAFVLANLHGCAGAARYGDLRRLLKRYDAAATVPSESRALVAALSDHAAEPIFRGTVAAVLIVRDEEEFLPDCLASLRGTVDEIVVLDTGSLDRTIEIAREAGATIGHFEWRDDFSAARNAALALARSDWVLWIDADERLEPGSAGALRAACAGAHFGGFEIEIVNDLDGELFLHHPVRVFRNDPLIRFQGRVHEQVGPSIHRAGLPIARLEGVRLLHLGYRQEVMSARGKIDRTVRLCAAEAEADPADAFAGFNLTNAYHCGGHHEEAVIAGAKTRAVLDPGATFAANLVQIEMASLVALDRAEEAAAVGEWAEEAGIVSVLVRYERARALTAAGDYDAAREVVERALELPLRPGETGDPAVRSFKARLLRARLLLDLEEEEEAVEDAERVLAVAPKPARSEAFQILVAAGLRAQERGDWTAASNRFARAAREGDETGARLWLHALMEAESDELLSTAKEVEGAFPVLALVCGKARAASGDLAAAEEAFMRAVQVAPGDAHPLFCLGDARYGLGRYAEAAGSYEEALRLQPDHADGWFTLGNALAQLGGEAVAMRCYRQCLALDPDHFGAAANLRTLEAEPERKAA